MSIDDFATDALGRKRSSANTPGARKGIPSPIAGRTFPLELLTPREVDVFLATAAKDETYDARDKAMIWLMYRCDLKIGQVVKLRRSDWDAEAGTLTVAPGKGTLARIVRVDPRGRELLERWIEVRRHLPNVRLTTPLFCQVQEPARGRDVTPGAWRKSLEVRARKSGIEKRINAEGLRAAGRLHSQRRASLIGAQVEAYIDDHGFHSRYPEAHDRWQAAMELFGANSDRHVARIMQDCVGAVEAFAAQVVVDRALDVSSDLSAADCLARVVDKSHGGSSSVGKFLKALLSQIDSWSAPFDPDVVRPGQQAQRAIYQAMILMYEVDRALTYGGGHANP